MEIDWYGFTDIVKYTLPSNNVVDLSFFFIWIDEYPKIIRSQLI